LVETLQTGNAGLRYRTGARILKTADRFSDAVVH
jgi:hypothetical protein